MHLRHIRTCALYTRLKAGNTYIYIYKYTHTVTLNWTHRELFMDNVLLRKTCKSNYWIKFQTPNKLLLCFIRLPNQKRFTHTHTHAHQLWFSDKCVPSSIIIIANGCQAQIESLTSATCYKCKCETIGHYLTLMWLQLYLLSIIYIGL